jgi:hypothetical protein
MHVDFISLPFIFFFLVKKGKIIGKYKISLSLLLTKSGIFQLIPSPLQTRHIIMSCRGENITQSLSLRVLLWFVITVMQKHTGKDTVGVCTAT